MSYCSFPDCKRYRQYKDGYCSLHHTQSVRYGYTKEIKQSLCATPDCQYSAESRGFCHQCYRKTAAQRFAKNIWQKHWKSKLSIDRENHHRDKRLLNKYGISLEQYRELFQKQAGRCAICGREETEINPKTNKIRLLSVDHNHKTNKVRGLLCKKCNQAIGLFQDSPSNLLSAYKYILGDATDEKGHKE